MRILLLAALSASLFAQQTQAPTPATQPAAGSPAAQTLPARAPAATVPSGPPQAPPVSGAPAAPAMSPAEAYQYAMQPLNDARSAPDDLTDADKWALAVGIARAKDQCEQHSKDRFEGEDLLAEGKLCIFGQDYEPARQRLVDYIALPQPKAPEIGRLLLARAFIGLGSVVTAANQMESILSLFPYDASIHLGFDMVIDAAAASDATDDLAVIPRLNEEQLPHTFDALAHGGSLSGNGDSVDAALLFRDALRCADALRRTGHVDEAAKIVAQVKTLVSADPIASSASYPAIQNALARFELFRQPSPVRAFHGAGWTTTGANIARVVPLYDTNPAGHRIVSGSGSHTVIRTLDDRTLVLVFSLAGPASADTIRAILTQLGRDHITPGLKVIAVTSFAANIGVDVPTAQLFVALQSFRAQLPPKLAVLIVPDAQLKPFAIDMWPAAILFDGHGRILWLNTISGSSGSIRQTVRELETPIVPIDLPPNSN